LGKQFFVVVHDTSFLEAKKLNARSSHPIPQVTVMAKDTTNYFSTMPPTHYSGQCCPCFENLFKAEDGLSFLPLPLSVFL
jgi:hypothetical protein